MTEFTLLINDEIIDGCCFSRNSIHYNGKWEVYLTHKIGSVRDQFGRAVGRYTSGKGIHDSALEAYELAKIDLCDKLERALLEQNTNPPKTSVGISSETEDLLTLLELK